MSARNPATGQIKAIETHYAGCRFRSRLEARWAVFFDTLGITWQYEPEGFQLPSGWYLPDFWLPEFSAWVEVKGSAPTHREARLAIEMYHRAIEADAAGEQLIKYRMLVGDIPRASVEFYAHPGTPGIKILQPRPGWLQVIGPDGQPPAPEDFAVMPDGMGWTTSSAHMLKTPIEQWELAQTLWIFGWARPSQVDAALTAARSARFEHGERGR